MRRRMPDDPEETPPPALDRVLSYHRPPALEAPAERSGEGVLGCLAAAVGIPAGVVVIAFVSYATRLPNWLGFCLIGTLFAAPLGAGLALRKSHRWHALAAGLLFGVGIAALLEGICFLGR
jgi:hypothetical protein